MPSTAPRRCCSGWAATTSAGSTVTLRRCRPAAIDRGKRIRPLLALLCAAAAGGDARRAAPLAAGVELLHNFTLVHDDIQDQSPTRRHRATVWKLWGAAQAINAGDALFAAAHLALFRLRQDASPPTWCCDLAAEFERMTIAIVGGQVLDLGFEGRNDVTPDAYLTMIAGKTAAIVRYAAWAGALLGGADAETADRFAEFGLALGSRFPDPGRPARRVGRHGGDRQGRGRRHPAQKAEPAHHPPSRRRHARPRSPTWTAATPRRNSRRQTSPRSWSCSIATGCAGRWSCTSATTTTARSTPSTSPPRTPAVPPGPRSSSGSNRSPTAPGKRIRRRAVPLPGRRSASAVRTRPDDRSGYGLSAQKNAGRLPVDTAHCTIAAVGNEAGARTRAGATVAMDPTIVAALRRDGLLREGHFAYRSGRHSAGLVDRDRLLADAALASHMGYALAKRFFTDHVDTVAAPSIWGAGLAQWVSYFLEPKAKVVYATPTNGDVTVAPKLADLIADQRVLIVDNLVMTGETMGRFVPAITALGGTIVGIGTLWDGAGPEIGGRPVTGLLNDLFQAYAPADCPLCRDGGPAPESIPY